MNYLSIKGKTLEEFNSNLNLKVTELNSSYFLSGIKTYELETSSEVVLVFDAPEDDETFWKADKDFSLIYKKEYEEGFIEITWAKTKWVISKNRTINEIESYLDNESIDERIFFVEKESPKTLN